MRVAVWAAIVSVTALVYWPALAAGFVGDDFMILHRLRSVSDAGDALRFFRHEFFGYYRPLAFVSHSFDWLLAGAAPRQFHLTNLLLHLASTTLVFLIASAHGIAGEEPRRRLIAGTLAALLFGLHASNHEAVIWMSARFDLLATFFSLAAVWWMVRGRVGKTEKALAGVVGPPSEAKVASPQGARERSERVARGGAAPRALSNADLRSAWLAGLLFFPALLSKESAVALPIAAAAWAVFRLRATTGEAVRVTVPWLAALAAYAVLRSLAGGIPAAGGAGRLPKLVAFAAVLTIVMALADSRWLRLRDWLRAHQAALCGAALALIAIITFAAAVLDGAFGALAREKLAVAGFAIFYLLSPVVDVALTPHYLDPATRLYWIGGAAACVGLLALAMLLWRRLLDLDAAWFAGLLLVAALIPISALTEGQRYLYLPSAAVAILAAILILDLRVDVRRLAVAGVALAAAISTWQISRKAADWVWAGQMTADGARLVDAALPGGCGGHVVFLTSPVAVRGVYTHFYYETFELARGCRPEIFNVLVRVVRLDTVVDVRWAGPRRVEITVPEYEGNFVLSRDLRHFDVPLRTSGDATLVTPLGEVRAEAAGRLQRITLTFDDSVLPQALRIFYYTEGRIVPLVPQRAFTMRQGTF